MAMVTVGWILVGYLACFQGQPFCQPVGTGNLFLVMYPTNNDCLKGGAQIIMKADLPDQTTAIPTCAEVKIPTPEPKPDAKDSGEKVEV